MPEEAYAYVPDATDLWAPDISFYNDKYHLYYSISTFGSNHSAMGLATNPTLDPDDENFEWTDQGIVVRSQRTDFYNAIDPNLILDEDNVPWLSFGSFWGGIKLVQLDYETGKVAETEDGEAPELISLATREDNNRAVEAPFIIHRNDYYYLFVSYDSCCQGINSTYNVRVGRSEDVTGPERWSNLYMSHELYNLGHMYESATDYYRATGKRAFLDICLKSADLI